MKILYIAAGFAAIGLSADATSARADGPVRQGLRATGEVAGEAARGVAQGTRAVVGGAAEGTRAVVGGAVEGTRAVVGGAADATRAVVGGAADVTRGTINALTPELPLQARANAQLRVGEDARDARWRFARHNGEWWYYSPENSWMYHRNNQWNQFSQDNFAPNQAYAGGQQGQQFSGQYGAGYRGEQGGAAAGVRLNGRVYQLRHDAQGREFIIEGGRRVYFTDGQQGQQGMSHDQQGNQPTPAPMIPQDPNQANQQAPTGQQGSANGTSGQLNGQVGASAQPGNAGIQAGAGATVPAQPTPAAPAQGNAATSGAIQGSIPQ